MSANCLGEGSYVGLFVSLNLVYVCFHFSFCYGDCKVERMDDDVSVILDPGLSA